MSLKTAIFVLFAGLFTLTIILYFTDLKKMTDPDSRIFFVRGMLDVFYIITGCHMLPIGILTFWLTVLYAYILTNDRITLLFTVIVVLISLRIWVKLVIKKNTES